jgi:type IX secretion system PorP/SprF family membrane protein
MDGNIKVSAIHRTQWTNFDNGYKTIGLSAELATDKNINIGAGLFQQSVGNGGYKYLAPYAAVNYTGIRFGKDGYYHLNLALNVGVMNRQYDPSKFKVGTDWTPSAGYVQGQGGFTETFNTTNSTVFDMGAGLLLYDGTPNKKMNLYFGYSAGHLTQPTDPFLKTGNERYQYYLRHTLPSGVRINVNDNFSITPNLLYLRQGTVEERMVGLYAQMRASQSLDFLFGLNYRVIDAIVPFFGLSAKGFTLGVSYDHNISDLGKAVSGTNSFEISLSYTGSKNKKYEPEHFICPSL